MDSRYCWSPFRSIHTWMDSQALHHTSFVGLPDVLALLASIVCFFSSHQGNISTFPSSLTRLIATNRLCRLLPIHLAAFGLSFICSTCGDLVIRGSCGDAVSPSPPPPTSPSLQLSSSSSSAALDHGTLKATIFSRATPVSTAAGGVTKKSLEDGSMELVSTAASHTSQDMIAQAYPASSQRTRGPRCISWQVIRARVSYPCPPNRQDKGEFSLRHGSAGSGAKGGDLSAFAFVQLSRDASTPCQYHSNKKKTGPRASPNGGMIFFSVCFSSSPRALPGD